MVGMIKTEIVLESQHGEDGKDSDEVLMRNDRDALNQIIRTKTMRIPTGS